MGIDTYSFEDALYNALREAPDVILIGEIRDRETMKQAIGFAETGQAVGPSAGSAATPLVAGPVL